MQLDSFKSIIGTAPTLPFLLPFICPRCGREGEGGRWHCLILCKLFQSIQVSKSSTGLMRFFIHNYYKFLSFQQNWWYSKFLQYYIESLCKPTTFIIQI